MRANYGGFLLFSFAAIEDASPSLVIPDLKLDTGGNSHCQQGLVHK